MEITIVNVREIVPTPIYNEFVMIFLGITFQTNYAYNKINLAGFIMRDHLGNPLFAAAKKIGRTEILVAQAIALREGPFSSQAFRGRRLKTPY